MEHKNIKIFKSANKMSIMDVISALDYHKENKSKELVYKGSLMFRINEYGGSKITKSAYLGKSDAKTIAWAIMNDTFERDFPQNPKFQTNFIDFGGGENKQTRQVVARSLSVRKQGDTYTFQIEEGPGFRTNTGGYQFIKDAQRVKVYKQLKLDEAKKMAHEMYSFIQQSELFSFFVGKPFYTILPENSKSNESYSTQPSFSEEEQPYQPPQVNPSTPVYIQDSPVQEQINQPPSSPMQQGEYFIPFGALKGTSIRALSFDHLEALITSLDPNTPEKIELIEEARKEIKRRS